MKLRPISEFEPYVDESCDCAAEAPSPQWLVVVAEVIPMTHGDKNNKYNFTTVTCLAFHDPVVGFFSARGELLNKVTHFHITDLDR